MAEPERVLRARRAPVLVAAKRCACAVSAALLVAASREAHAQSAPAKPEVFYPPPRVHVFADLAYERAPDASICPDERTFRRRVQARTAIDSFAKNPRGAYAGRVRVQVSRTPSGFAASYTWVNAEGATKTERLTVNGTSEHHCFYAVDEAAASLAGALVGLEMDLGSKLARRSTPKPCPPSEPCPLPVESNYSVWPKEPLMLGPKEQSEQQPERWPLAVRLAVATWPELIVSGRGSFGLSAELGVRYRFFSVGSEIHGDPPLDARSLPSIDSVRFARLSGALLVCAHYRWFIGCGVVDVGRFLFLRDATPVPASLFYGAAGARMGLEIPLFPPRIFFRGVVDLRAAIRPATYSIEGRSVFEAAGLGVGVGLGIVVELPP